MKTYDALYIFVGVAKDDVVEAALEKAQKVLARLALLLGGHLKIGVELVFEDAVVTLRLLLLAELEAILGVLGPALTVLAGGVGAALDGALLGIASVSLEKELLALSAAQTADSICISCHVCFPPFPD